MNSIDKNFRKLSKKVRDLTPKRSSLRKLFTDNGGSNGLSELNKSEYRFEEVNTFEITFESSTYTCKGDDTINQENDDTDDEDKTFDVINSTDIGLECIAKQIFRNFLKDYFNFNLMVLGGPGLGKSTLVNSMFLQKIYSKENNPSPSMVPIDDNKHQIRRHEVLLMENKVILNLNVIDFPEFGRLLDNRGSWNKVSAYIDEQHKLFKYMRLDTSLLAKQRESFDSRVHLVLYFIAPNGHFLTDLDILTMKALQDRVNLMPIIARSDSFTDNELNRFKKTIRKQLKENNIQTIQFQCEGYESEEERETYRLYAQRFPLAIIASDKLDKDKSGILRRVQKYKWGVIDVDDIQTCDYRVLHDLIIKYTLHKLVAQTDAISLKLFDTLIL